MQWAGTENNTFHCEAFFVNGVVGWGIRWRRFLPRFSSFVELLPPVSRVPSSRWDYYDSSSPTWWLSGVLLEDSTRAHVFCAGRADCPRKRFASWTSNSQRTTQLLNKKRPLPLNSSLNSANLGLTRVNSECANAFNKRHSSLLLFYCSNNVRATETNAELATPFKG